MATERLRLRLGPHLSGDRAHWARGVPRLSWAPLILKVEDWVLWRGAYDFLLLLKLVVLGGLDGNSRRKCCTVLDFFTPKEYRFCFWARSAWWLQGFPISLWAVEWAWRKLVITLLVTRRRSDSHWWLASPSPEASCLWPQSSLQRGARWALCLGG